MDQDRTLVTGKLTVGLGTVMWNGSTLRQVIDRLEALLEDDEKTPAPPYYVRFEEKGTPPAPISNRLDDLDERLRTHLSKLASTQADVRTLVKELDAWAARIQRLEALPGVQEALETTQK